MSERGKTRPHEPISRKRKRKNAETNRSEINKTSGFSFPWIATMSFVLRLCHFQWFSRDRGRRKAQAFIPARDLWNFKICASSGESIGRPRLCMQSLSMTMTVDGSVLLVVAGWRIATKVKNVFALSSVRLVTLQSLSLIRLIVMIGADPFDSQWFRTNHRLNRVRKSLTLFRSLIFLLLRFLSGHCNGSDKTINHFYAAAWLLGTARASIDQKQPHTIRFGFGSLIQWRHYIIIRSKYCHKMISEAWRAFRCRRLNNYYIKCIIV